MVTVGRSGVSQCTVSVRLVQPECGGSLSPRDRRRASRWPAEDGVTRRTSCVWPSVMGFWSWPAGHPRRPVLRREPRLQAYHLYGRPLPVLLCLRQVVRRRPRSDAGAWAQSGYKNDLPIFCCRGYHGCVFGKSCGGAVACVRSLRQRATKVVNVTSHPILVTARHATELSGRIRVSDTEVYRAPSSTATAPSMVF
jgi:hypothetical protein